MKPGNRRHPRRTVLILAETAMFLTDEKGAAYVTCYTTLLS